MKKILMIVISLAIVGLGSYFIFDKVIKKNVGESENIKETEDISKDEEVTDQNNSENNDVEYSYDTEYTYEEKDNGDLIFYKDGNVISEYKCDGVKCEIDFYNYNYDKHILGDKVLIASCDGTTCEWIDRYGGLQFLYENDEKRGYGKVLLYDIPTGKYKEYDNVKHVAFGGYDYIRILELLNNEYIIVSTDGKIDRKVNYDDYIFSCYEGCTLNEYMYNENVIIYKQNGKYGIQRLDSGKIIVNAIYDDMRFAGNKYYIAKTNDKYNLYNVRSNELITKKGYDNIFFVNEELLLVYENKEISFINLKEEKLINDTIHVDNIYPRNPKMPLGVSVSIMDNNIFDIYISDGTSEENNKTYVYKFNLNTHELIKD